MSEVTPSSTPVALLGIGLMGEPMAISLLQRDVDLRVWNRTHSKTTAVRDAGATAYTDLTEACAGAKVVVLMLSDSRAVSDVLFEHNLLETLEPGTVVVDMSSIAPADAIANHRRLANAGIGYLDCPVSGGTRGASDGTLTIFVGGEQAHLEQARWVLEAFGTPWHLGPAGSGQFAKLANQIIVAITIGAVAEAIRLAEDVGLNVPNLLASLGGGFADSRILREHGPRIATRDFSPGGAVKLHLKDMNNALEAAANTELPLTELVTSLFQRLVDDGMGELDHSALFLASGMRDKVSE